MDPRLNHAAVGYFSLDAKGRFKEVNNTFLDMIAFSELELIGKDLDLVLSKANAFVFFSFIYPILRTHGSVSEMHLNFNKASSETLSVLFQAKKFSRRGEEVFDCFVIPMSKRMEYEQEIRSLNKNLTEAYKEKEETYQTLRKLNQTLEDKQRALIEANEKLYAFATLDHLTKLYNRRIFIEKLEKIIKEYRKNQQIFSLYIVDIDFFKKINDDWGHLYGDEMLIKFSETMRESVPDDFTIARFGGEEFVILMPGCDEQQSLSYAEKLRVNTLHAKWNKIDMSISCGVATFTEQDTIDTLLAKADYALYHSKENGRNQVTHAVTLTRTFHDPEGK